MSAFRRLFSQEKRHAMATIAVDTALWVAALATIKTTLFDIVECSGPSMMPTINRSGDCVLVERLTPQLGSIKRGDVVIAVSPQNPQKYVCKRVQGVVPKNHVWLLGDNGPDSLDSRDYGPVPLPLIRARVVAKVWPPQNFCLIPRRPEICQIEDLEPSS